jgi:hypothetical protein
MRVGLAVCWGSVSKGVSQADVRRPPGVGLGACLVRGGDFCSRTANFGMAARQMPSDAVCALLTRIVDLNLLPPLASVLTEEIDR